MLEGKAYSHILIWAVAFCWLILFGHHAYAQNDSLFQLREIEVTAQRLDLTDIGKHSDVIDSQILQTKHHENLASILSSNSPLFVRSYGAGTLATLGIRGGGAAHTQLLWNGIPLRNPMIGLMDLSLFPSAFIDDASIHYGGHGAAFGSGAVGGLISFNNAGISDEFLFKTDLTLGSWEKRNASIQIDYGFDKLRFSTRGFAQNAENNYRYRIAKGLPEKNQLHNHLKNHGILQEVEWQVSDLQNIIARVWYQYADRQIPPTSTQNTSQSAQQDVTFRSSLQWNYQGRKTQWSVKTAWLDESIDFQDSLILLYTHNRFKTWLAEGEASFRIAPFLQLTGGIYTEIAKGESVNYLEGLSRSQTALYSSARLIIDDVVLRLQAREELTEKEWSPILLDISGEWKPGKNFALKASLSKNYRAPSLNDLHWRPGGNPSLTPEQGWTIEGGAQYFMQERSTSFFISSTAYTRRISDWIMWMPPVKDVSLYWSPINVAEVSSKGIETRSNFTWSRNEWSLSAKLGLDLTWSIFEEPLEEFMIEEGEQLFYVPVENLMMGLVIRNENFSVFYDHRYFGKSTGINDDLTEVNVGYAGGSYSFLKSRLNSTVYLQVENVWNVPYRIIERRPMPGRSISAGVKFSFS